MLSLMKTASLIPWSAKSSDAEALPSTRAQPMPLVDETGIPHWLSKLEVLAIAQGGDSL